MPHAGTIDLFWRLKGKVGVYYKLGQGQKVLTNQPAWDIIFWWSKITIFAVNGMTITSLVTLVARRLLCPNNISCLLQAQEATE